MKTNKLKLTGVSLTAVVLLGTTGCHSNGMPQSSNGTPTDTIKRVDSVTNRQNVPNTRSADTNRKDTGKRRMDTIAK